MTRTHKLLWTLQLLLAALFLRLPRRSCRPYRISLFHSCRTGRRTSLSLRP